MASSSKRLTRSKNKKETCMSFKTVVYPREDKIEICPKFRATWCNELEDRPWGYLLHSSGNTGMLELCLTE
ncbi:hypothetical protein L195_g043789, partial [Trifolium pratense]